MPVIVNVGPLKFVVYIQLTHIYTPFFLYRMDVTLLEVIKLLK